MTRFRWLLAAAPLTLAACHAAAPSPEATAPEARPVEATLAEVGLDEAALDRSVDPCSDFYTFACGSWIENTEIPADRSRWSRSFNEINERNLTLLRRILEEAAADEGDDPVRARIGGFYAACMDEGAIEAQGLTPLKPLLDRIEAIDSPAALAQAILALHQVRVWAGFDLTAEQDFKDATRVIAFLDQNGLGLPDRDYYLKDDEATQAKREAYRKAVATILGLAGAETAQATRDAEAIVDLETRLAEVSLDRVTRRDPEALYHLTPVSELTDGATFPWASYFEAMGLGALDEVNVATPDFLAGFDRLLTEVPLSTWKPYLRWHLLGAAAAADALPKAFVDAQFELTRTLTGQEAQQARWKRCVTATDQALGELVGQAFVAEAFPGESKADAERMIAAISEAFEANLAELAWMDDATRTQARDKLHRMVYKIGYPDRWREYGFEVRPDAHAANYLAAAAEETRRDMAKIGKPVDRGEWFMSPATVNAYYNGLMNEMVFPAGILQAPFYDVKSALAVNLGAMGMVVGHELTHGFDDKGSKFAGDGNLRNWWSPEVGARFEEKTRCVAEQYGAYEPLPGLKLNGNLTLGENVSDIGGIKLAYEAWKDLRAGAADPLSAGGFTEDQLFFLSVGQVWCAKARPQFTQLMVKVDPHSPPRFRVNGALANVPAFGEAFACEQGTPMRPADACTVW